MQSYESIEREAKRLLIDNDEKQSLDIIIKTSGDNEINVIKNVLDYFKSSNSLEYIKKECFLKQEQLENFFISLQCEIDDIDRNEGFKNSIQTVLNNMKNNNYFKNAGFLPLINTISGLFDYSLGNEDVLIIDNNEEEKFVIPQQQGNVDKNKTFNEIKNKFLKLRQDFVANESKTIQDLKNTLTQKMNFPMKYSYLKDKVFDKIKNCKTFRNFIACNPSIALAYKSGIEDKMKKVKENLFENERYGDFYTKPEIKNKEDLVNGVEETLLQPLESDKNMPLDIFCATAIIRGVLQSYFVDVELNNFCFNDGILNQRLQSEKHNTMSNVKTNLKNAGNTISAYAGETTNKLTRETKRIGRQVETGIKDAFKGIGKFFKK